MISFFVELKKLTFVTEPCSNSSIRNSIIQLFDGNWKPLTLSGSIDKGTVSGQNINLPSKTETFVYTIKDPLEVKNGLVIQCYGVKIIKITLTE